MLRRTVCTLGKDNAQNLACSYGVITECLIEITYPKEQKSIRMFALYLKVLLHQRGLNYLLLLCHIFRVGNKQN